MNLKNLGIARYVASGRRESSAGYSLSLSAVAMDVHGNAGITTFLSFGSPGIARLGPLGKNPGLGHRNTYILPSSADHKPKALRRIGNSEGLPGQAGWSLP
jgi:hypothetical protein